MALNVGISEQQYLLKMLEEERVGRRFRPFASDAGFCPTKNWFFAHSTPQTTNQEAAMSLYQGIGNGVEEAIINGFKRNGMFIASQVKLPLPMSSYGIDIGGYIDMLAYDRFGRFAAYEIKTIGTLPDEPQEKHLAQAMTYACLGGLDVLYIVYVSRNVQSYPGPTPLVSVFEIDVERLLPEYMTKIVLTADSLSKDKAPHRPAGFRKTKECAYCPFIKECWKEDGFEFMDFYEYEESVNIAAKTAYELIDQRNQFVQSTISSAFGSYKPNVDALKSLKGKTPKAMFKHS